MEYFYFATFGIDVADCLDSYNGCTLHQYEGIHQEFLSKEAYLGAHVSQTTLLHC